MLSRIETMTLMGIDLPLEAIRRQIASGVDILVHLGRMRDKSRKLLEITEVCGFENGEIQTRPLYRWEEGKGLVKTGELLHCEKMKRAGISLGKSGKERIRNGDLRGKITGCIILRGRRLQSIFWRELPYALQPTICFIRAFLCCCLCFQYQCFF